jgi:8-oxo-dGTP diphosphatase
MTDMIENKLENKLLDEAQAKNVGRFVVGAIIPVKSRVLLLQRPADDFMGGYFELPSGQVEDGESLSQALLREVKEETNRFVQSVVGYVDHFDYESGSGSITRQWTFVVSTNDAPICLSEHTSYAWIEIERLGTCKVSSETARLIQTASEMEYV